MSGDERFYVKCRSRDEKRFSFLTSSGGTTYLRVHAARFTRENADKLVRDATPDNPDFEFKVVPVGP